MEDKLVIWYNEQGHGRSYENVAVFTSRRKFVPISRIFNSRADWQAKEPEVDAIADIKGVSEVACYEHAGLYDLVVIKASSYTWEELNGEIVSLLNCRYNRILSDEASRIQ